MIDPMMSLQCRAVRMVPLVTFGVPVMTPAESPQDRRRPKMTDHILAILSARDGHGRWSGPDQDHARRSTCLPGHCTALAWPGDAVVAAVMAPVEGKNAKMTKSPSGSRTGPGAFSRLLNSNFFLRFSGHTPRQARRVASDFERQQTIL